MLEVIFTKDKPAKTIVKVIAMFENKSSKVEFADDDEAKLVERAVLQAKFGAKSGEHVCVYGGNSKIILLGLGKNKNDVLAIQDAGVKLFELLFHDERAYIFAEDDKTAKNLAFGVLLGSYSFDKYKTEKKDNEYTQLEQIALNVSDVAKVGEDFKPYIAMVNGIRYSKDLCNEPANCLSPKEIAYDIKRLEYLGIDVELLDVDALHLNGLNLIEAVGKGSNNFPYMAVMKWRGNPKKKDYDLGLVGKGVCFDGGGLSIKTNAGMQDMKMDMAGAAAVIATVKIAALQRLKKNLVAVMPLVENMPDGNALKIGDVITSYNGKTVEICNTDAEGRLIVADALSYIQKKYKTKQIINVATLGSLNGVLGKVYAGVFANDDKMADLLIKSGEMTGEKLWRMPLDEQYEKFIKSPIADIKNVAIEAKASIVSAAFLNAFIEKGVKWSHIDVSNVKLEKTGLASGFGVKLLNEFIRNL